MLTLRPVEPGDLPVVWALSVLPNVGQTADPSVPREPSAMSKRRAGSCRPGVAIGLSAQKLESQVAENLPLYPGTAVGHWLGVVERSVPLGADWPMQDR